jgi:hypothetical protein
MLKKKKLKLALCVLHSGNSGSSVVQVGLMCRELIDGGKFDVRLKVEKVRYDSSK